MVMAGLRAWLTHDANEGLYKDEVEKCMCALVCERREERWLSEGKGQNIDECGGAKGAPACQ